MLYEKILDNHLHLRLMTMYKRAYITDPLNGVLKTKSYENMSI